MSVFKQKCKCGFEFVFGDQPKREVEVKCPKCNEVTKIEAPKEKGSDK